MVGGDTESGVGRLPAIYHNRGYAFDGGLISYGPNIPDAYQQAAPEPSTCSTSGSANSICAPLTA
jgi:hypothetical protein